jgi:carboxyl-terminal processing protease
MIQRRRNIPPLLLLLVTLVLGISAGMELDRRLVSADIAFARAAPGDKPDVGLLNEAWNKIDQFYVDRSAIKSQPLTYGAISGMVDALGDTGHSRFMTPQMVQAENNFTQGQFEGIGAEVQMKDDHVMIVAPMDNSPAQRAGLRPGDIIQKVNGQDVTGLSLEEVVGRVLGPAGTTVTLTILDPKTGNTRDVALVRERIKLQNVAWQRIPGSNVGHVRISAFSQGVTADLQKALAEIKRQGLTGVVLDLRNNPGGLLDEAIGTASQFLHQGNVLLVKDAQGKTTPMPAKPNGVAYDIPMVVLVNNGTASASEIVAGAIQDGQQARLVGETTFGTGTVLNQFPLSDGSALLLATEEWLTPKGRVIWHNGIAPDVVVALPANVTPLTPEAEKTMTPQQVNESGDAQLLKAIDLLK